MIKLITSTELEELVEQKGDFLLFHLLFFYFILPVEIVYLLEVTIDKGFIVTSMFTLFLSLQNGTCNFSCVV